MIKFTKESEIKFISHLDLMRTIQRIIRRAKLPVEYSKGFNPHMNLSIAQPLSVGIYSKGEYMDLVFTEELDEEIIRCRLNDNAPSGIKFTKVIKLPSIENGKKIPQIMALLDAADYSIRIHYEDTGNLDEDMNTLMNKPSWNTVKKSKSGEKEVDIKQLVKKFKYSISGDNMKIEAQIACGSRENLSAELLSEYIKINTRGVKVDSFTDIMREEMYTLQEKELIPVASYLQTADFIGAEI